MIARQDEVEALHGELSLLRSRIRALAEDCRKDGFTSFERRVLALLGDP